MQRLVERDDQQELYSLADKARIGIIGISDGAGVSFITLCLAKAISGYGLLPAVLELGKGSSYDAIGIDKRFAEKEFFSFHKAINEGVKIRNRSNVDEKINWILRGPCESEIRLSGSNMQRMINNIAGDVILCDFSGIRVHSTNETFILEILKEMDAVIVVIDPMPSKMIPSYNQLQTIHREFKEAIYVVNKNNRGVNTNEMMRFLRIRRPVFLPLVPPEDLYAAEYCCKIAYGTTEVKKILYAPIREILRRAIPQEIIKFN